jgi:tetratricopeptide (TPR) repeat protein
MKKSAIVLFFSALVSVSALAQNVLQGVSDLYAERYQSAKANFEKLLAANPNNIEANYWLGQTYIANKDLAGAKSVYDKALASSNNAPLILVGQGQLDLMQGKAADARQRFETAINASRGKKGNDPNILNAVGRAIVEAYTDANKTDLDYAIAKLKEAVQIAPTNPDINYNLGNAYRKKRDGSNAVLAYNKAGNFAPALYRIGLIYQSQRSLRNPNDWDVVLEHHNKAVAADPRFAPAYLELYRYNLFAKRDFPVAEDYANKILSSSDPGPEANWLKAQTVYAQGKFAEAITLAKDILAQAGGNAKPRLFRLLTASYMANKDTATSCEYSNQFFVKATNDEDINAEDYLMHIQACGKNSPDIILADLDKLIKKDPENAITRLREAQDDAKRAQQRILEGEIGLIIFKLQGEKANRQTLVSIGTPFYYGSQFQKADSLFQEYNKSYPDSIYGHLWSARAREQIDTSRKLGLAAAEYEHVLRIAETDKARDLYRSSAVRAAFYLSIYSNDIKEDRNAAIAYVDRGLAIDPTNATLTELKKALTPKQSPSQQRTSTSK